MNRTLLLALIALPLLAQAQAQAQAKVYRWVDARGQVHYSQTPPPDVGAEETSIRAVPATSPPAAPASATPKPATAPPAPAAPKVDDKAEREAKTKRCTEARERVSYLEEKTARRLGVTQPDGSLARMTDEEFQERLDKAQVELGKACGN